jgi:hypothetical protein
VHFLSLTGLLLLTSSQVGGILPEENISENIDLPSSSIAIEETEVDTSNLDPVDSSVALEDSKQSEAEMDGQMNVSQVCGIVPENVSEEMDLLQCPSATKGENIEGLSEKGPVSSIVAMEESDCSKPEMDDQMDASQVHTFEADKISENMDLPVSSSATEGENVEGLSEKGSVDSSKAVDESKGSEAEEVNQIVVSQHSSLVPESISEPVVLPSSSLAEEDKKIEGISEPVVLPSSSLAEEDKKIEGLSDKGPVSGSVPLEESKGSETETGDQMIAFQAGLIVTGDTVSEHVDLPSSSLGTEEEDMEGLPEKGPISSSVPLEESNCPKAEMGDRIDASQVGGLLPDINI